MKLLKEHIETLKKERPTPEKEAEFEEFKKNKRRQKAEGKGADRAGISPLQRKLPTS
jgi:hypothetical protein